MQHFLIHPQLKVCQEAETDLQPPQLGFGDAPDFGEAPVRVAEVLERLHRDPKGGEDEAVCVAAGDGEDAFDYRQAVDVEGGSEVYGCGHGTVLVQTEKVFFERDRRRPFRVKFPGYSPVLDVEWFRIRANDVEGFRRMCFGRSDGSLRSGRDVAVVVASA